MIKALKDEVKDVQIRAAFAFWEIGEPTVEPLIRALNDEYVGKGVVAMALGEIGDDRAAGPLIRALINGPANNRDIFAWALGKIGDNRAVDPLIRDHEEEGNVGRDGRTGIRVVGLRG